MGLDLGLLERLEHLTSIMLEAAQAEDWETVASNELERKKLLADLPGKSNGNTEHQRRLQLLRDNSLKINDLVAKRRDEIGELLSAFKNAASQG